MILIQRQNAASVLSLNQTEGEELLRISQAFPPPPEGQLVDFCDGDTSVPCSKLEFIWICLGFCRVYQSPHTNIW